MEDETARAEDLRTTRDIIDAARRALPDELWDYAVGGSEDEATLRRNRLALEAITFRPRVLRDVGRVDLTTSFLGIPLALPVMLAPVGSIGLFHPEAALPCARAASRAGTAAWISTMAAPGLAEVAAAAPGPKVFQIYVRGDRDWLEGLVRRAEAAGYAALCLTVDSAVYGRRERDMRRRFEPRAAGVRPNVGDARFRDDFQARLTWEDAAWLRRATRLPLILKGVLAAEDAVLAVEHGYEAVCVSNHGGRQLDYLPGTLEVLPEIVAAVGGRAEVVVDGGFLRGTDAVKALALGARAVLVGKAMVLALAAAGEAGVVRLLELLAEEMRTAMALLGARDVGELTPGCLRLPPSAGALPAAAQPQLFPS
jgi:isopentenyl diphosphate isomerase/L-lactate dehydrogenase-like FMN-dependent dehydrogenase